MPKVTLELTAEDVQDILFQLPPNDFLALAGKIRDRAETLQMMRLAETGFCEWEHEEEDICEAELPQRKALRPASGIRLRELQGGLEHSATFAGSPMTVQERLRREWD